MGVDPHVVGRIWGSDVDYGAPLHAQPDFKTMECPQYSMDNLWRFKWGSDNVVIFEASLKYLGNCSLTAEVHHFQEVGRIITQIEADIKRLEMHKWEAGCLQDVSIHCLESANTMEWLDRVQIEQHMQAVECAEAAIHHGCTRLCHDIMSLPHTPLHTPPLC